MFERNITFEDIENALQYGEVVEQNRNSKPYPTTIVLGSLKLTGDEFHIVFSKPIGSDIINIITIYFPEEKYWGKHRIRRKR